VAAPFQRANEPDRGAAGFPTPFRRENESNIVALQDSPLRVAGIRTRPSAKVVMGNTVFFLRSAVAGNLQLNFTNMEFCNLDSFQLHLRH
jgi:hypothetical protein